MGQELSHARGVSGVYVIVHVPSGRAYLGSSCDIGGRWYHHRGRLRRAVHSNPRLQAAWDEHGEAAFRFLIVERCAVEALRARELWWLAEGETWDPDRGFNLSRRSDTVGFRFTDEQRARVSAGLRGKPKTAEHRAAMAARVFTPEQMAGYRSRMAALGRSGKGKPKDETHRQKIGLPQRGSRNHGAKLDEAKVSEIKRRLADGERGRHLAAEFGVHESIVSEIKSGRRWRHVS